MLGKGGGGKETLAALPESSSTSATRYSSTADRKTGAVARTRNLDLRVRACAWCRVVSARACMCVLETPTTVEMPAEGARATYLALSHASASPTGNWSLADDMSAYTSLERLAKPERKPMRERTYPARCEREAREEPGSRFCSNLVHALIPEKRNQQNACSQPCCNEKANNQHIRVTVSCHSPDPPSDRPCLVRTAACGWQMEIKWN